MAIFSKVIKDHNEMRKTIMQLEAVKIKIKASVREQTPPDEFALRNNTSAIGQVGFEGNEIVDNVIKDTGTMSVEILLKTLFRGIESTLLNPRNANDLWTRIKNSIANNTPTLRIALQNLTTILDRLSSNTSFSSADTQQIKVSIGQLLKELFPDVNQRPNLYNYNQYNDIRISNRTVNIFGQPPGGGNNAGQPPGGGNNAGPPAELGAPPAQLGAPPLGLNDNAAPVPVVDNNIPVQPVRPAVLDLIQELQDEIEANAGYTSSSNASASTDGVPVGNIPQPQFPGELSGIDLSVIQPNETSEIQEEEEEEEEEVDAPDVPGQDTMITPQDAEQQLIKLLKLDKNIPDAFVPRKMGYFQNLIDRNMRLSDVKINQVFRARYQSWGKLIYLGGVMYVNNFRSKVINDKVDMVQLIESIELVQNPNRNLFQTPKDDFVAKFLFDTGDKWKQLRSLAYPGIAKPPKKTGVADQMLSAAKQMASRLTPGKNKTSPANQSCAPTPAAGAAGRPSTPQQNVSNASTVGVSPAVKKLIAKYEKDSAKSGKKKSAFPTSPVAGAAKGPKPSNTPTKTPTFTNATTPLVKKLIAKIEKEKAGAKSGKGLKHTGLKTVKQIISRTENLIQAANLGNKSPEVRNELDTLLAVLIDRKEVRPQFRTNLMKKLF